MAGDDTRASAGFDDAGRGFPWAGLLATVLVLLLDAWVMTRPEPWLLLEADLPEPEFSPEGGVARDRIQLAELIGSAHEHPRVLLMGTSRARRGLLQFVLERELDEGVAIAQLAHAGLQPFELRTLVEDCLPAAPDVVVLALSEYDTHRPVKLMDSTAGGSWPALAGLAGGVDPLLFWDERDLMLRLATQSLLNSYRHRPVVLGTDTVARLHFERPDLVPELGTNEVLYQVGVDGLPGSALDGEARTLWGWSLGDLRLMNRKVDQTIPEVSEHTRRVQLSQVISITRGRHAEVQSGLLERSVARLSAAGVQVLILEMPLHPLCNRMYDGTIREDFLALCTRLASSYGAHVVTLEQSGPFVGSDFRDLTHLNNDGAFTISSALARKLNALLRDWRPGD